MIIKMNTQYLVFGKAIGNVDYGVEERTYLFGIFSSEEMAKKSIDIYQHSGNQIQVKNEEGKVIKLYHLVINDNDFGEYHDGFYLSDEELDDPPVLYSELEYFIKEFSNYNSYPTFITSTGYSE